MKKPGFILLLLLLTASRASAQNGGAAIHIAPTGDGFDNFIAAAMAKKHVQAALVVIADLATV
jgi:hypothetical protein